mmetsp:Transcript_11056/g.35223  ORF Transcript_11056/g.35223 Transcript_11056/m.35223 type:complete len:340 (+) Transcript_11056:587-1606(+)
MPHRPSVALAPGRRIQTRAYVLGELFARLACGARGEGDPAHARVQARAAVQAREEVLHVAETARAEAGRLGVRKVAANHVQQRVVERDILGRVVHDVCEPRATEAEGLVHAHDQVANHVFVGLDRSVCVDLLVQVIPRLEGAERRLVELGRKADPLEAVRAAHHATARDELEELAVVAVHTRAAHVALEVVELVDVQPALAVVDDVVEEAWARPGGTAGVARSADRGLDAEDHLLDSREIPHVIQAVVVEADAVGREQVVEKHDRALLVRPAADAHGGEDEAVEDVRERPVAQVMAQARNLDAEQVGAGQAQLGLVDHEAAHPLPCEVAHPDRVLEARV